jgi:hypothetical protein
MAERVADRAQAVAAESGVSTAAITCAFLLRLAHHGIHVSHVGM